MKVEKSRQSLHKLSKVMLCVGVGALAYIGYQYMYAAPAHHSTNNSHRLGASNVSETSPQSQAFSAMSVMIWGLVVAKAKSGVEAAQSKDAASVGGLVKKVGVICSLIAGASILQLMASMDTSNAVASVSKAIKSEAPSHKLSASREEEHPASFYDESSSHYLGGAHNRLIESAKKLVKGSSKSKVPSQKSMGGAHNSALAVLTEESNKFKAQRAQKKSSNMDLFSYFSTSSVQSEAQYERNLLNTQKFVAFIAGLALCVYFFVTFKTYHAHLEKSDSLNTLLKNPNARVACGEKGKKVMRKMQKESHKIKAIAKPDAAADPESLETLISAASAKKAQQAIDEKSELLLSGYQAPKITVEAPAPTQYTYQLVEPVAQPKTVVAAPVPQPQQ